MPFITSIRKKHDQVDPNIFNNLEITGGDVVYTAGGYKIHMFTTVGESSFTVKSKTINSDVMHLVDTSPFEYLVIGGGGAGGSRHGGGGGAGGMIVGTANFSLGGYPVTVGAGGSRTSVDGNAPSGQNSTFNSVAAIGGGGGGSWGGGTPAGATGGSGSGGTQFGGAAGSAGIQPGSPALPNSSGFGFPGGTCYYIEPQLGAGGGGGAGGRGGDGSAPNGGSGGPGRANSILGINYFWAGGGGGGCWRNSGGPGGQGGGGASMGNVTGAGGGSALNNGGTGVGPGSPEATGTTGGDGGANTGSGGGGALQAPSTGGAGGPGIVVVRYRI